jgi:two-component system sensor kinase FixL
MEPTFYLPVGALLVLVAILAESRRRHAAALHRRDLDDRRRLEERVAERTDALRESEERLRLLLETVQVIPWVADARTWAFTYVGPQAVDVLGYPIERWFEPSFWEDHMHPDDAEEALALCARQAARCDRYEFEYRMIAADGSIVWLHDLVSVVAEDGEPTMLRGFMIDITARKKAESERIDAETEALEHRERLAHLSRVNMLGEMATGIAHEVNQPLTAVSTYTQACRRMIEAGLIDQDQIRDVLARISEEAVRAGEMIHGLKALVRKRNSELKFCNVNDLVRDVIPLARVESRARGIEIRLHLADGLPAVLADDVQIQQVVLNLIRNAIEATEPGYKAVDVYTGMVEGDLIEVAVADYGAGVEDVDPERVFEPFFSTKQKGMGMGLSISRSIVEAHGGRIGHRPGSPHGTTFFFRLPAESRHAQATG